MVTVHCFPRKQCTVTIFPTLLDSGAMGTSRRRIRYLDAVIAVFLFAALIFVTPVLYLWTGSGAPWYAPYLLWLLVIVLSAWAWRQRAHHE